MSDLDRYWSATVSLAVMRCSNLSLHLLAVALVLGSCANQQRRGAEVNVVHRSAQLIVTQLSPQSYIHTSFHQTNDFGQVPCNGLVVFDGAEAVVFDTPTKDSSALELIRWIQDEMRCSVKAVVPTHFHVDCLGGLNAFHTAGIASYANERTRELAAAAGETVPQNGFADSVVLMAGTEPVLVKYLGEGHTADNVVGYFARDRVLFGGCLIKELNASKGYLGDANVAAWPATVLRVKEAFPHARSVVPGHGAAGDQRLLDYTIALFKAP